jgi:hypothetical protein
MKSQSEKQALVLDLMAQDALAGLNAAVAARRQELVRFIENVWDKYRVTLGNLRQERLLVETKLTGYFGVLGYE